MDDATLTRRARILALLRTAGHAPTRHEIATTLDYVVVDKQATEARLRDLDGDLDALVGAGLLLADAGVYLLTDRSMDAMERAADEAARALVSRGAAPVQGAARKVHLRGRRLVVCGTGTRWPSQTITSTRSLDAVTCASCRLVAARNPAEFAPAESA